MQYELLYLILGLVGLWVGAELVTRGSISIAKRLKISHMFMGLTVLAMGSDLPELFIDITAALQKLYGVADTSGLIVGETVGTVISQTTFILGVVGLFGVVIISKREFLRDGLVMVGAAAVMLLMSLDGQISMFDGIIMVIIYIFYFMTVAREEKITEKIRNQKGWGVFVWSVASLLAGFVFLIVGARATVDNAVVLANIWGVSQTLIGLLIVGFGTSLPELSICANAVMKKAGGLSIGNLIGSNIFDILFTLGLSSIIAKGFNVNSSLLEFDVPFMIGVAVLAIFLLRTKMKLEKREAITLILVYIGYVALKLTVTQLM
ncbi:calcium/sodium antiporter [Candidatus Woesearchaeota archaeon]|nr:calcium/sodium antiporter [Candidatus Woesearchaeota archaeon]MBW3005325.1 calcium/sodium antiporter [Candidatus Woesearchaeota archaeon]